MVGADTEAPRAYYSFSTERNGIPFQFGIIVNQRKSPHVLSLPASQMILVGHDQAISVVDFANLKLSISKLLDGLFYEFLSDSANEQILVVHELGVIALSMTCEVKWSFVSPDVLLNWQIEDGKLRLDVTDSPAPYLIDLRTGNV